MGLYRVLDPSYAQPSYSAMFAQAGANALVGVVIFQIAELLPGVADRRRSMGGGMHINRRLD